MRTLKLYCLLLVFATLTFSGSVANGVTTCPTSGSKQVATGQTAAYQLTVQAATSNADIIYVGGPEVSTSNGLPLTPGSSITFSKPNNGITTGSVRFACGTNTDGIVWIISS